MSNDTDKRPSHIAYQVREGEGEDKKAYFNRIGAAWTHQDGEGFTVQLDALPVGGRAVVRSVKSRLQEAKDNARDGGPANSRRDDRRGSGREERQARDAAPRYER